MSESNKETAKACLPRTAENLTKVVAARNVEQNKEYLPGNGLTWCNKYVRDLLADLGVPLPKSDWFAHQQIDHISGPNGQKAGWKECDLQVAQEHANAGEPVLVTYRNPKTPPAGHSHIALMMPAASLTSGRGFITQAGRRNYVKTVLSHGFGTLPVKFYWHE